MLLWTTHHHGHKYLYQLSSTCEQKPIVKKQHIYETKPHEFHNGRLQSLNRSCVSEWVRGGSRIFLRRGCTSKEWRRWRWGEKKFKNVYVYTKKKASSQGGMRTPCTLPLDPPLWVIHRHSTAHQTHGCYSSMSKNDVNTCLHQMYEKDKWTLCCKLVCPNTKFKRLQLVECRLSKLQIMICICWKKWPTFVSLLHWVSEVFKSHCL